MPKSETNDGGDWAFTCSCSDRSECPACGTDCAACALELTRRNRVMQAEAEKAICPFWDDRTHCFRDRSAGGDLLQNFAASMDEIAGGSPTKVCACGATVRGKRR